MPLTLDWPEIVRRLLLALAAGLAIGFNRTERGRPAGLRTTTLVCLAAALSMVEANLLLSTAGKTQSSFAQFDVMRLPLGILTGMGFIGAGTVLRRDQMVLGVTTAATLWFVTVAGLCFGGGQVALGAFATVLALGVLWGLKQVERRMRQERLGTIHLKVRGGGETDQELENGLLTAGLKIMSWSAMDSERNITCEVRWAGRPTDTTLPPILNTLAQRADVLQLEWNEMFPHGL
jgi:putative Mg2+ transporter-C (MgtC) family protein